MNSTALSNQLGLNCVLAGKTDAGLADVVCGELATALAHAYPGTNFDVGGHDGGKSASVIIHNATLRGLGLQLVWTAASGKRIEGERMSVSAMDRQLSASQRQSLYARLIAANPMPR